MTPKTLLLRPSCTMHVLQPRQSRCVPASPASFIPFVHFMGSCFHQLQCAKDCGGLLNWVRLGHSKECLTVSSCPTPGCRDTPSKRSTRLCRPTWTRCQRCLLGSSPCQQMEMQPWKPGGRRKSQLAVTECKMTGMVMYTYVALE